MGLRAFRSTRRPFLLFVLCATIALVVFVGLRLNARIRGIFREHAGVTLTQGEIAAAFESNDDEKGTKYIPRIIHQIFHNWHDDANATIPDTWDDARHSCMKLHEDWEYILWTGKPSREFIEREYPWFLETYDGFTYPVQRVDALRYFLMRHYGGIYIDLDNGCKQNLEPLLYYPTWLTDGGRGALSNNILGAQPNHPFWELVTDSLLSYSWNYPLPYLTISYATGQWFITDIWQRYHKALPSGKPELTRVMMDGRPGAAPSTFFSETKGGSWDNWDNYMFKWIGNNILLTILGIVATCLSLIGVAIGLWKLARLYFTRRQRYQRVKTEEDSEALRD